MRYIYDDTKTKNTLKWTIDIKEWDIFMMILKQRNKEKDCYIMILKHDIWFYDI